MSQVSEVASSGEEDSTALSATSSVVDDEGQSMDGESWKEQREEIPLKTEVEWLDYEHFKNRYTENDGFSIIEVLVGNPRTEDERGLETKRRARGDRDVRTLTHNPKLVIDGDKHWMQRIRIQSPQLIYLLSCLTGNRDLWPINDPHTFFRPFRCFYYCLPQLKQFLKLLESATEAGKMPMLSPTSRAYTGNHVHEDGFGERLDIHRVTLEVDNNFDIDDASIAGECLMTPEGGKLEHVPVSKDTVGHLRKLVDLTEKNIVPLWYRARGTSQRKFRFFDLWMAFKPGELLYTSEGVGSRQRSKMYQRVWRLLELGLTNLHSASLDDTDFHSSHELRVRAYYIDYDGDSFRCVKHQFEIDGFEGEKDITTLVIHPLRFIKDNEKIKDNLHKQGLWFCQVIKEMHFSCDGWTLTCAPNGDEGKHSLETEHIDSNVIVDFAEGYKSEDNLNILMPRWSDMADKYIEGEEWNEGYDHAKIIHWKPSPNNSQLERFVKIEEKTQIGEWYSTKMREGQIERRRILKDFEEDKKTRILDDDDILLLPRRVIAYTLRERRFVLLDIQSLQSLTISTDALNDLKIDPAHKFMVRSLVQSHLEKQATKKLYTEFSQGQDLFRGKGSGLFILLHGVPGVGKTATAEAIAQYNQKPLFVITCGDLGFTPSEVEYSLTAIFRLAHLWNCVLLLDEADVFLSRRELGDLKRNALVSVFLRVLEYYSGILFLTTNRVGTLDEAFKSRIHISLYYPPLDYNRTIEIFKVNIRKMNVMLEERERLRINHNSVYAEKQSLVIDTESILDFAHELYVNNETTPERRWNGRQIRNAFQIAYSLAEFDTNTTMRPQHTDVGDPASATDTQTTLGWDQFNMVYDSIKSFESYLSSATNGTDSDRARLEQVRDDSFAHSTREQSSPHYSLSRQRNPAVGGLYRQSSVYNSPSNPSQLYPPIQSRSFDERQSEMVRNPNARSERHWLQGSRESGGGGPPHRVHHEHYEDRLQRNTLPHRNQTRSPAPHRETGAIHLGNKAPNPVTPNRDQHTVYSRPRDAETTGTLGGRRLYSDRRYQDDQGLEQDEGYGFGDRDMYQNDIRGVDELHDSRRYVHDDDRNDIGLS